MAASDKKYAHSMNGRLRTAGAASATLVADTYVIVPGVLTAEVVQDMTADTTLGKLTNKRPMDQYVRVAVDVTLTQSSGSSRTVTAGIEVDGTVVESWPLTVATATATRFHFEGLALLPAGSFVRLLVKSSGTEALTSAANGKVTVFGIG